MRKAYKLIRQRRNGSLGPLFINRKQIVPVGEWVEAECHPTKDFALRPGWHTTAKPEAPHLSTKGRVWVEVEIEDFIEHHRPENQGGLWFISKWIKIVRVL